MAFRSTFPKYPNSACTTLTIQIRILKTVFDSFGHMSYLQIALVLLLLRTENACKLIVSLAALCRWLTRGERPPEREACNPRHEQKCGNLQQLSSRPATHRHDSPHGMPLLCSYHLFPVTSDSTVGIIVCSISCLIKSGSLSWRQITYMGMAALLASSAVLPVAMAVQGVFFARMVNCEMGCAWRAYRLLPPHKHALRVRGDVFIYSYLPSRLIEPELVDNSTLCCAWILVRLHISCCIPQIYAQHCRRDTKDGSQTDTPQHLIQKSPPMRLHANPAYRCRRES